MSTDLQHLGKYELRQRLAHNSMAEIWKSYDSQLRRFVAMKFLRANLQTDPDFSTRFVREAEIIASSQYRANPRLRSLVPTDAMNAVISTP